MSPTLRRARILHTLAELGAGAADLFTRPERRRHIAIVAVDPVAASGHLPRHFRQLAAPRPYDREAARG